MNQMVKKFLLFHEKKPKENKDWSKDLDFVDNNSFVY